MEEGKKYNKKARCINEAQVESECVCVREKLMREEKIVRLT